MLQIIISPAKKMNILDEYPCTVTTPVFFERTKDLYARLQSMSFDELKKLWQCSDKLAAQNYERLHTYDLCRNQTPALLSYEGIQYQYIAPGIFSDSQWDYVNRHLRILSGFYGVLKPTDGVIPYRLEMQAKLTMNETKDLYAYWKNSLYEELCKEFSQLSGKDGHETMEIINLASAEYSKSILPYLDSSVSCITCIFGELVNGKVKVKATQAKIARGEMVRWMAEHQIKHGYEIQNFNCLDYQFQKDLSSETEYVFTPIHSTGIF